jgi:flagellar hook-basal body complex protein FliE
MSVSGLYATPEVRMRAASQPLEVRPFEQGSQRLTVSDLQGPEAGFGPQKLEESQASTFSELLRGAVQSTSELGHVAHAQADAFARGSFDDLHGAMITAKEAEISMRLVGSVRTKLLDAFHELWRINV